MASIEAIWLKLLELQKNNLMVKELRGRNLLEGWKDKEGVFQYWDLLYISEIICSIVISRYHNNQLVRYLKIDETRKLVTRKYFWPTFCQNIEAYVIGYDV